MYEEKKANWIGKTLRRNGLPKHVKDTREQRIKVTGRSGIRRKQLLDNLKETRRYWKLKKEELDCTIWEDLFLKEYGPVIKQTT
jgi:hypothetical protein